MSTLIRTLFSILLFLTMQGGEFMYSQKAPRLGIGLNYSKLPYASGDIFGADGDHPHGNSGFSGGLSLLQPLGKHVSLWVEFKGHYESWHFHMRGEFSATGRYKFASAYLPASLLFDFPLWFGKRSLNAKFFLGGAVEKGNFIPPQSGLGPDGFVSWTTSVNQGRDYEPEMFSGLGLIANLGRAGELHFQFSYHLGVLKNRHFTASYTTIDGFSDLRKNEMRSRYKSLGINYFPAFKRRGGPGKCPKF